MGRQQMRMKNICLNVLGKGKNRMREEQFQLPSNDEKTQLHCVKWIPDGEIKAVVQLVHGMAEHIERYRTFAQYLNRQGILVAGHDHLGHGDSIVSKEEYGYFAAKNGNRILVKDIHRVYQKVRNEYEGVPYILMGHSMGSFLVRQYLCCFGTGLDGAVVCGTGFQPQWLLKTALGLCRIEAQLFGWYHRSKLFQWMVSGSYNAAFRPNRTASDWLCRDEAVVDAYEADERCGFPFTLNGYYNLFLTIYKIERKEYLERMPRNLPVLFIAGEKDPVGGSGEGVRKAAALFEEIGMRDVTCRLYPGARHEILNEHNKEEVFKDVLDWLEQKQLIL